MLQFTPTPVFAKFLFDKGANCNKNRTTPTVRECQKIGRQAFPISGVRLFAYRVSDMDGHSLKTKPLPPHYKGNVRTEQTPCTRTVRTQDMEMTAGLFCGSPSHHLNLTIQHKKKKGQIYIHPFPKNPDYF